MSSEPAYITFLGRSLWAMLNAYHAVLRERGYRPKIVHIFAEELFASNLERAREGIAIVSRRYDFMPEIRCTVLKSADYHNACQEISGCVKGFRDEGRRIALDITPGRKALVVGAIVSSLESCDHIFYLAIDSLEGAAKPYLMIPLQRQHLKDFREEIGHCSERGG